MNYARMTSRLNFIFNIKQKTLTTQIRDLEKENIHFESADIVFLAAQVLLNSNKYIFLADPIGELASYFQVTKSRLIEAIWVEHTGGGYIALLNANILHEVVLDSRFQQISEVSVSRCPVVDVKNTNRKGRSYSSCNGAILALFLHCVTNVHLHHCNHWSIEYLKDTKELLMPLPVTAALDTVATVGAIFRTGDVNVRLCQITKHCEVLPPIIIAKDYNGVFDLPKSKRRNKRK
jgi:hypothetical protein